MNSSACFRLMLIFSIAVVLTVPTHSQVTLQLGAGAGVLLPMGDYNGQTTDYYAGSKYGLSTGYTIHAKGRVSVLGFAVVGGVEYGHLSNSGEGEPGHGQVEVSQSIVTIKAGPEFSIPIPMSPVTPYVGANIAWHSLRGTTSFRGLARVPSGSFDVEAVSRIGFGINAGVVFVLAPLINLDLGAEYAFVNPLSKGWNVVDARNDARINSYKSLNDDKDPRYAAGNTDHFISATRSISTFQVTATVMLGL